MAAQMRQSVLFLSLGRVVSRVLVAAVLLFFLSLSRSGFAEPETPTSEMLRIANRPIIELKGPVAGHTAQGRVEASRERIEELLVRSKRPQLTVEDTPYGTRVLMDGSPAFLVTLLDVNDHIGETTHVVAEEALKRLETAVSERREQQSRPYLLRAALVAGGATILYIFLMFALTRLAGRLAQRLGRATAARAQKLKVAGHSVFHVGHILRLTRAVILILAWVLAAGMTVTWLAFSLTRLPYTRPWGEELELNLVELAKQGMIAVAGAVPGLLVVVVIASMARVATRSAGWLFDRVENRKVELSWIDPDSVRPTRRITTLLIWVFALVMAYPYLPGSETEAFKGLSVLLGLMISLGGSSMVGQAASGLTLMYARTIRVGDCVRIGDAEGTVIEIGMIATRLRTGLGQEITIPSATVMSSVAKNYSRAHKNARYYVDTEVTIGYSTPWRQVHAMLLEAAVMTSELELTLPPVVSQVALSDYYVAYRLTAYAAKDMQRPRIEVLSNLHANIQDVFNRYGVQIMSPHYRRDPAEPQVVPPEDWFTAPARKA